MAWLRLSGHVCRDRVQPTRVEVFAYPPYGTERLVPVQFPILLVHATINFLQCGVQEALCLFAHADDLLLHLIGGRRPLAATVRCHGCRILPLQRSQSLLTLAPLIRKSLGHQPW